MADLKNFAKQLVNLTVREVNELVRILRDEYGIGPVTTAIAVTAGSAVDAGEAAVEKTEFNIILKSAGINKLAVVELVKSLTGPGLKEAREVANGAPSGVKGGASKEEAKGLKKSLEGAGAEVELK